MLREFSCLSHVLSAPHIAFSFVLSSDANCDPDGGAL
jgi:hypothetical protein